MTGASPVEVATLDMHTGGEPVRIVTQGYPDIPGRTILDKRRYAREHLDHMRRMLMFEPRGHADMYGVIPVAPNIAGADMAVLFMHNEGYSTMCGHAVIALGRYAVERGLVAAREPESTFTIQCPCGPVTVTVEVRGGRAGRVRFESVPAFAFAMEKTVMTAAYGPVIVDIGYGGAFYAVVAADQFGLDVRASRTRDLIDAASAVSEAARREIPLSHPDSADLAFLYGTILTDGNDQGDGASANVCVFADAQVDRSPTGSGVTARIALQHRRKLARLGEERRFESVTGAEFTGKAVRETTCGQIKAVVVEVAGAAHFTGESRFWCEPGDEIGKGFRLR
jgi:proline racemase